MAELKIDVDERPGIAKEIDSGAMDLIYQAIQEDPYSYPVRSFVRETISNGLDSITERNIFDAINCGDDQADYYLQRQDGKLLKDSAFDASYYDINHLSSSNKVVVTYKEGYPRDLISVRDRGVGLGGSRLKGFFKLGYSSKRNLRAVIGKFGAGAKSGLATGVEYFVMHTTYNGYRTSFMIYKHDYDPITPPSERGKSEVWNVKMSDGTEQPRTIYWENVEGQSNGVQIDLEVKKHNKDKFLEAVKSQFQYFKGQVTLKTIDEDGNKDVDALDETPDYDSKSILIPRYSTYTAPHILVDGISYGLISWEELELERRTGKIAIKVSATDVDITMSRESLKWTEKTKKTILGAIRTAKDEAAEYVAKSVALEDDQNLFEIMNKYSALKSDSNDNVKTVFSKFLNMHDIVPKFPIRLKDEKVITGWLGPKMFDFIFYSFDLKKLTLTTNGDTSKVHSTKVDEFRDLHNAKIIFAKESGVGPKLVNHLLAKYDVDSLIYVRPNNTRIKHIIEYKMRDYSVAKVKEYTENLLLKYGDLFIDDYEVNYNETDKDQSKEIKASKSNLAMIRKMNKEVLYTDYYNQSLQQYYNADTVPEFNKNQSRHTVKIKDLKDEFIGSEMIICTGKFKDLGRLIELTQLVMGTGVVDTKVIYVAQDLVHHFVPYGTVITDYLRQVNTNTGELMIGEHIRALNTWRMFDQLRTEYPETIHNYQLLKALTDIDVAKVEDIWNKSSSYSPRAIIEKNTSMASGTLDDIFAYLEGLKEFQKVVQTADKEAIATKALALFNSDEIYHIESYDEEFIHTLRSELERIEPITDLAVVCNKAQGFREYDTAAPLFNLLLRTIKTNKDVNI